MKNKLWIFGCSFTTSFNMHFIRNAESFSWPNLLAKRFNLELKHYGHPGQCNWVNILHFIDVRDEIGTDDIVIFEFTFFDRHNFYPTRAQIENLQDFWINSKTPLDKTFQLFRDTNYKWFAKQVNSHCLKNNINIFYWSAEGIYHTEFLKYHKLIPFMPAPNDIDGNRKFGIYESWQNEMEEQWIVKPDGSKDKHFNQIGHERLANHFENCIKNNIVYNYE